MKFKHLVWLSAFILAACAAFVSVSGLSKLFAGGGLAVYIMIGGLEFSKLVAASLLHRYWGNLSILIKTYLTIGVVVLISITSMGIYGYLSDGYQKVSKVVGVEQSELSVFEAKKNRFEKSVSDNERTIERLEEQITSLYERIDREETRVDGLLDKNYVSNSNKVRNSIDKLTNEINVKKVEIKGLVDSNIPLGDSALVYQVKIYDKQNNSEVSAELGPLIFLSNTAGIPMDSVVNYLIIIIMLVFDPLAVILLISANKLDQIDSNKGAKPESKSNTYEVNDIELVDGDLIAENEVEVQADEPLVDEDITPNIPEPRQEIVENPVTNQIVHRKPVIPTGKITREDIPLVNQAINRGFTVKVPNPRRR
jgi:hypothetical protein